MEGFLKLAPAVPAIQDDRPVNEYYLLRKTRHHYSRGSTRGFFGTVSLVASGNTNPTRYGDFLTARVQEPVDVAFIASSYADNSGGPNTRFVEFMRQRYQQAYIDRGTK